MGAEFQGEAGENGGGPQQHYGGEQTAEGGSRGGNGDGAARLAVLVGHGVAVQTGSRRVSGTGGVDHNGGDRTAVNSAAEDAQHHQNAHVAVQGQGDRQHDGHAHDRGQPRHHAYENAAQDSA